MYAFLSERFLYVHHYIDQGSTKVKAQVRKKLTGKEEAACGMASGLQQRIFEQLSSRELRRRWRGCFG